MTIVLLSTFVLTLVAVTGLWLVGLARRDASIMDPFWGTGFVLLGWFTLLLISAVEHPPRTWLLIALTTIWGLRLTWYLFGRNRRHGEDKRYTVMRQHHGDRFWWVSFFTVFLLQGLILWIVSLTLQVPILMATHPDLGWLDACGVAAWAVGMFFETVGDFQMARFQADPKNAGQVMDRGLWRYTRHPNYFGDTCVWWGLYLIAAAGGAVWTFVGPLLMTWLLLRVSGVSLLESTITARRPAYVAYQKQTSAFFPWTPRAG